jgi:hypothetical protein
MQCLKCFERETGKICTVVPAQREGEYTSDECVKRRVYMGSEKKRVLITGVSRGIGRAIARILVEHGYEVFGTSRNPERIPPENRVAGVNYFILDLADYASIDRLVDYHRTCGYPREQCGSKPDRFAGRSPCVPCAIDFSDQPLRSDVSDEQNYPRHERKKTGKDNQHKLACRQVCRSFFSHLCCEQARTARIFKGITP